MNQQRIKILVSVSIMRDICESRGHAPAIISNYRSAYFQLDFYLNEIEFMNKTFQSRFRGYEENEIANEIAQTMTMTDWGLWSHGTNFNPDEPHTIEVQFADGAKEIFDMIVKHKPKLLEQWTKTKS